MARVNMSVVIRLARRGKVKKPHYYIVVQPREKHPKGGFIEKLGYYVPQTNPATLVLDMEKAEKWIAQGALPSDRVAKLIEIAKSGGPKLKETKQKKFADKFVKEAAPEAAAPPEESPVVEKVATEEEKPAEAAEPAQEEAKSEPAADEESKS